MLARRLGEADDLYERALLAADLEAVDGSSAAEEAWKLAEEISDSPDQAAQALSAGVAVVDDAGRQLSEGGHESLPGAPGAVAKARERGLNLNAQVSGLKAQTGWTDR